MTPVAIIHPYRTKAQIESLRMWCTAAVNAGYAPVVPFLSALGPMDSDRVYKTAYEDSIATLYRLCSEAWVCGAYISPDVRQLRKIARLCGVPRRTFSTIGEIFRTLPS